MGKDLKGKELGVGMYQRKNGVYSARYVDRFGKRRSLYNKNLKELKESLNTALYENKMELNIIDDSTRLDDWYEKWLSIHKYNVIRANTKRHYEHIYRKHISPVLGSFKLTEISQLQIRGLIRKLDKSGLQFETQNKVRILLLDMFDKAVIDDFVKKNPVRGIRLTRNEDIQRRVLSPEEQAEFFECCRGTFYDNLFITAISTGLRPGELCALTWEDINLENMEITVSKTLLYQKLDGDTQKTFHIEQPKTKTSSRKIPINRQCEMALKKQKLQKDVVMSKSPKKPLEGFENLLFTTKYGTPINAVIYSEAIKRIVDEINLCKDSLDEMETFSGHCFRHSFATRCFEAGIQPKTVQNYLGHATLQMTMDLYTHVLEDHKKNEMDKLDKLQESAFTMSDDMVEQRFNRMLQENNHSKVINF